MGARLRDRPNKGLRLPARHIRNGRRVQAPRARRRRRIPGRGRGRAAAACAVDGAFSARGGSGECPRPCASGVGRAVLACAAVFALALRGCRQAPARSLVLSWEERTPPGGQPCAEAAATAVCA